MKKKTFFIYMALFPEIPEVGDTIELLSPIHEPIQAIVTTPASLRHNLIIKYLTGPKKNKEEQLALTQPYRIIAKAPPPQFNYYLFYTEEFVPDELILYIEQRNRVQELLNWADQELFLPDGAHQQIKQLFKTGGTEVISSYLTELIGASTSLEEIKKVATEYATKIKAQITQIKGP